MNLLEMFSTDETASGTFSLRAHGKTKHVFILYIAPISFYMIILLGSTITHVIMVME